MSGEALKLEPLPEGFEPMPNGDIAKIRRVAVAIGENNVKRMTWKRANKEQVARGWASSMTMTMESMVEHNDSNMVASFINVAAEVLTYALDSLRLERASAEALRAERDAAVARAEAAEAAGFQRAIDAALAIIDARHDKEADEGTEFSPYHAGMVDALSWASDEVGELATKAKAEGADR